ERRRRANGSEEADDQRQRVRAGFQDDCAGPLLLIKGGTIGAQSERYAPENRDVLQLPKPPLANDSDQAQKGGREGDVVIHANEAAILLGSRIKLSTLGLGGAQRL